jgi:hypothetical protein
VAVGAWPSAVRRPGSLCAASESAIGWGRPGASWSAERGPNRRTVPDGAVGEAPRSRSANLLEAVERLSYRLQAAADRLKLNSRSGILWPGMRGPAAAARNRGAAAEPLAPRAAQPLANR